MAQFREDFKHLFNPFLFRDFKSVLKCFAQWECFLNLSNKEMKIPTLNVSLF